MSAVSITCRRTFMRLRNLSSTVMSVAAFLSATGGLFTYRLIEAEGLPQQVSVLWAAACAPFLPILAALLGMDVWSDERRTGRLDLLLSTAVREHDFVVGKFLGTFFYLLLSVALSLVSVQMLLAFWAPQALAMSSALHFVPAVFALVIQGLLWSAVAVAVSSFVRQGFIAACVTSVLLVAVPRGGWLAAQYLSPEGRIAFGEMPLDAHIFDFSSGVISTGVLVGYASLIVFSLFVATQRVMLFRFQGRQARFARLSSVVAVALGLICVVAVTRLALRLDWALDIPVGAPASFSPQMRQILSESSGPVTITAFYSRNTPAFRPLAQSLRTLKRQTASLGGLDLTLRFVDPRWDVGAADRLVRLGAKDPSLVFEKGHRVSILPLEDGADEGLIATALRRVVLPPQRQDIYWTVGHGESSIDVYGVRGLSEIARELVRNGYRNRTLDLSKDQAIPADCALIVVAGAKDAFSRAEIGRLDAYLKTGGRLLVLMGPPGETGVSSLLSTWGIRPVLTPLVGVRTLSGTDVIVTDFADHPIANGIEGSRLVLERPLSFVSSAVAQSGTGADRLEFTSVASVTSAAVVAVVERGSTAGTDLAVRPTRVIVIGDPTFVVNGQLAARANANRNFFLNAVTYLSGAEMTGLGSSQTAVLMTGMDRARRARFALHAVVVVPGGFLLLMLFVIWRRRARL